MAEPGQPTPELLKAVKKAQTLTVNHERISVPNP